ncbi:MULTISPECIES: VanW family protein [unclassified Exiguobacterium]|uniref:VanW family protein n=1 Tax=unclassified Exiguobacterium TaxID=2644629 RepID=UPI00103D9108|nr:MULTISPECIES: VanW family protein [unclassified Exiguobacterium]TCI32839.1 vancomycin resistance protein [Exiguobacterium sp. SH4S7]TCI42080.1 vancomycin resistance protein [Exiguobacterium sp. SH5S32]TCI49453.1 vancomycin resistance protein [Exiguobacterium sp. SH1S4]TCI59443.1 vancomycin resistance protein [Exiguobacterium sp. SH0S2]TCI66780.1 vancomycin resistance protein [Exiguobacterium sp. SH1S1]
MQQLQPKHRSALRIWAGTQVYTLKRSLEWMTDEKHYASTKSKAPLPHLIHTHRTPLYRRLRDVDMEMQRNKVINLHIAIKQLNNLIVHPGEVLSYWKSIGRPTKRKGYVDGMILHYGKVTTGVGGGLCQLSNLIYWITLHSPLTVTERYRHSYDVFPDSRRDQPFGSGATCSYNYLDLQITNQTTQTYQLLLYIEGDELVGEWRSDIPPAVSYRIYEQNHHFTKEWWGGTIRHNQIFQEVISQDGTLLRNEFITENHALTMYDPFLPENTVYKKADS